MENIPKLNSQAEVFGNDFNGFAKRMTANSNINETEYKVFDDMIRAIVPAYSTWNNSINVRNLNDWTISEVKYYVHTDMSAAEVAMNLDDKESQVERTTSNVELPFISKKFVISDRELEASRKGVMPLDLRNAEDAMRRVVTQIDTMMFYGIEKPTSTYKWPGLYQFAVNNSNTAAGTDMATAGAGLTDVLLGLTAFEDTGGIHEPSYDFHMAPTQFYQLVSDIVYSGAGKTWDNVMNALQGGKIIKNIRLPATKGLIIPSKQYSSPYFMAYVAQEPVVEFFRRPEQKQTVGLVWAVMGITVFHPYGTYGLTTI